MKNGAKTRIIPDEFQFVYEADIARSKPTPDYPKSVVAFDLWNGNSPSKHAYLMSPSFAKRFGRKLIQYARKCDILNFVNRISKK